MPLFAIEVDIQPGERTETELQVPAGVRRKFLLPATGRGSMVRQIWRDAGGLVISDFTRSGSDNLHEVEMLLPPGTCSVEVIDATGASARSTFVIDHGEGLDEVLELPRPRK